MKKMITGIRTVYKKISVVQYDLYVTTLPISTDMV